ncbi:MAG: hypothetical protein B6I31_05755 [Desulfobacteraceae bacterium 4572_19]|nr:MAG: hypothetical protein B6I31_05755 [Desulfobacteraceae bacterium 4572_19]
MSKKQLFFIIITCAIISCAVIITGMIYQTNQTMQKDLLQQTHLISIQTLQWDMASKLAMPISIVLISLILLITFLSASLPRLKTSIKPVQQRLMIPLTIILLLLSGGFYFFLITVQQYNPNMINRQLIVIILAIGLVLLTGLLGFLFVILRRTDKGIRKQQEDVRIKHNFAEDIINTAHAIILVLDKDGKIINFNPFMERISGYRLEEVKGNDWFTTFLPKKDLTKIRKVFNKSLKNIQVKGEVNPIITKDNRIIPIEWYDRPTRNSSGKISGILAIGIDVTERIKAQEMLYKKNKTLTIINELNKTVVNATDENELLQKTCKMLVEQGGYLLARIGYAKYDKDNTVRSIAQYGYEEKYFQITDITWNDEETGRCPMKVAIAQKKPIVDHDIQNNPLFAIWHKDAIKRGYKSSIALPLLDKEQCIGALNLYSKQAE